MKKTIWILSVISLMMILSGFRTYHPVPDTPSPVTSKKTVRFASEWRRLESRILLEFEIPR